VHYLLKFLQTTASKRGMMKQNKSLGSCNMFFNSTKPLEFCLSSLFQILYPALEVKLTLVLPKKFGNCSSQQGINRRNDLWCHITSVKA